MSEQLPTVGRIVIYCLLDTDGPSDDWRVHPAIITRVHGVDLGCVNLRIFLDADERTLARTSALYDAAGAPGTWHWPPRA